jgi:hypothetical protein
MNAFNSHIREEGAMIAAIRSLFIAFGELGFSALQSQLGLTDGGDLRTCTHWNTPSVRTFAHQVLK